MCIVLLTNTYTLEHCGVAIVYASYYGVLVQLNVQFTRYQTSSVALEH